MKLSTTLTPPENLWINAGIPHSTPKFIDAGNFVISLDTNQSVLLFDVLTGEMYEPKFKHFDSPSYLGYNSDTLILVNHDTDGTYRICAYNLQEVLSAANPNSPSHPACIWEIKQSSNTILPSDPSLNIISYEMYDGIFTAVFSTGTTNLDQYMLALDVLTGVPVWNKKSDITDYFQIIVPTSSAGTTPTQLKEVVSPTPQLTISPYSCVGDGSFFLIVNEQLFAYNRNFGDLRFPKGPGVAIDPPALTPLSTTNPIFYANKTVIATRAESTTNAKTIVGLHSDFGELLWQYPLPSPTPLTNKWYVAAVSNDETLVALCSSGGEVQVVHSTSGKPIWTSNIQLTGVSTMDVVQATFTPTSLRIVPQNFGKLFTLKLGDSTPTLKSTTYTTGAINTTPMMVNGSIITCTKNGAPQMGYSVFAQMVTGDSDAAYFNDNGALDNSISFTLTDDSLNFDTTDYSIEFWMRSNTGGEVFTTTTHDSATLKVEVRQNGKIALGISDSDSPLEYIGAISDSTVATDGKWHHVAIAKESGKYHFYLDSLLIPSDKIQLSGGIKYFNDTYKICPFVPNDTAPSSTSITPPAHILEQLPVNSTLPEDIPILNQKGFVIAPSSANKSYVGLLREFRMWKHAISPELIRSRMNKILGPNATSNGASQTIKKQEPKLVVNVHMDDHHAHTPQNLLTASTSYASYSILNDIHPATSITGEFTNPCSSTTDLLLELDGFPYLIDKNQVKWPFEEYWAVRGLEAISTNAVMSSDGIICFGANNYIYGIRKHDGKSMWSINLSNGFSNPISTLLGFMIIAGGKVYLIKPMTGEMAVIADGAKSYNSSSATFEANHDLDMHGDYVVFANDSGGVSFINGLNTDVIQISSSTTNAVSGIRMIGSKAYWASGSGTSYSILGYDLENYLASATPLVDISAASPIFAVNNQYLYAEVTLGSLSVFPNNSSTSITSSTVNVTSLSGIALDDSGNHVVLTLNGTTTSPATLLALKPASLSQTWSTPLEDGTINPPVIQGQNIFCTYGTTVATFSLSGGMNMGSFTVENTINGSPLMDQTTAFFACEEGISGEIDGALHQVVFGDTTVLQFTGDNYVEITNAVPNNVFVNEFSTTMDSGNCCLETWVNLDANKTDMGILSLSSQSGSNISQLDLFIDSANKINFIGSIATGTSTKTITAISDSKDLLPINLWNQITVNVKTTTKTIPKTGSTPASTVIKITPQLFVNGKSCTVITTTSTTPALSAASGFTAYIGASGASTSTPAAANFFNGLIGYLRVWNSVQNVNHISKRMYTQLIGTEADLMAAWSFDRLAVTDSTQTIRAANDFVVTPKNSGSGAVPNYLLNELNFTRPNYEYLTYGGENNGTPTASSSQGSSTTSTYDAYILKVNAHKPDGSPLIGEVMKVWYTEGGNGVELYLESSDTVFEPTTSSKLTIESLVSQQSATNCLTFTTDINGCATIYAYVKHTAGVVNSGPGFDIYTSFLPSQERFHVNALINRQLLQIAPPPTVNAQAELIVDYHYEIGGKIDVNRQKSVYRTILRTENPDKSPRAGEMVTLYADIPQTIIVDGVSHAINKKNGATLYTDGNGELMVDSDALDLKGYNLEVWTGFMHRKDRVKFSVSDAPHKKLQTVTGDKLAGTYTTGWTGTGPQTSTAPLISSQYDSAKDKIASSFHHLMAAAHPPATSGGDSMVESILNVVKKSRDQQPTGQPMPDKISPLRTLTYIDRTKIMDIDAMKTSIQNAAALSSVTDAQGLKITTTGTGATKKYVLDYLTADEVAAARKGSKTKTPPQLSDIELGGFFGDIFDDIESAAESAAHAFTDLVHKAESLVLDLTNDVDAAICGVLNDMGPLGHVLADGIEKVMAVVDKIIHLIDVLVDTMLEFLMLWFEWDHIVATHTLLNTGLITPGLSYISSTLLPEVLSTSYLTSLATDLTTSSTTDTPSASTIFKQSAGDIKNQYGSEANGSKAHGIKSKTLINKSKSNVGSSRTAPVTFPAAVPSSFPGDTPAKQAANKAKVAAISDPVFSQLSSFNFNGSLNPLDDFIKSIGTTLKTDAATLLPLLNSPLEALLSAPLFSTVSTALQQNIDIPFVSALYSFITGGSKLTLIDLFSLIVAVPTFLIYEAITGNFFDVVYADGLQTSIPTSAQNVNSSGSSSTAQHLDQELGKSATAGTLPSTKEIQSAAIQYLIFTELTIITSGIANYLEYQVLRDTASGAAASDNPAAGFLNTASGLTSMMSAIALWNINANRLVPALSSAGTVNGHPYLIAYASSFKVFCDISLSISLLIAVFQTLKLERLFGSLPAISRNEAIVLGYFLIYLAIYPIVKFILECEKIMKDIGDTTSFDRALLMRYKLHLASTGTNIAFILATIVKILAKSKSMPQLYLASGVASAILAEATTTLICVEELKYGVKNTSN